MIDADLRIRSFSRRMAKTIIESVEPDNTKMKGLTITSRATSTNASFRISYSGRIETFISTLDDLLRCVQAAYTTLGIIRKDKAS